MSDMYYLTMAHFGRNMLQENFPHLQWTFLVVVDGVFYFIIVLYSLSPSQRYEWHQGHWFYLTGFRGHFTWVSHDPRLTIPRATFREILHLCLVSAHWCACDVEIAAFTEVVETGKKRGNWRSEGVTTMTMKIRTFFLNFTTWSLVEIYRRFGGRYCLTLRPTSTHTYIRDNRT